MLTGGYCRRTPERWLEGTIVIVIEPKLGSLEEKAAGILAGSLQSDNTYKAGTPVSAVYLYMNNV